MKLKDIYEAFNGDYESVIGRLRTDERIEKYLIKFSDYHYDELISDALKNEDYETAFREAHNLKGLCANLSIDRLGKSASELTESLRHGKPDYDITPLVEAMKSDYVLTISAINKIGREE